MFEEFLGIPMHPLVVHAAVVFLPLQLLAATVYALVPRVRGNITWLYLALAVIGPVAAYVARESGLALRDRKLEQAQQANFALDLTKINEHKDYADATFYTAIALTVAMLALYLWLRARRTGTVNTVVNLALTVVTVGLSFAMAYYIFRTGDSGAHMTWEGQ